MQFYRSISFVYEVPRGVCVFSKKNNTLKTNISTIDAVDKTMVAKNKLKIVFDFIQINFHISLEFAQFWDHKPKKENITEETVYKMP